MWGRTFVIWHMFVRCLGLSASSTELRTHTFYDINYRYINRQLDTPHTDTPLLATPPSIYWPNSIPATNPPPQSLLQPPGAGPTLLPPFNSSSLSSTPSNPTTPATTSSPSNSPTTHPIIIESTATVPREREQKFKLIYLTPLFIVLGVLWGSLTAWIVYGCMTRKPKILAEDIAIAGPRYIPAAGDEGHVYRDAEAGHSVREIYQADQFFSWPFMPEKDRRNAEKEEEDDPFLIPSLPASPWAFKTGNRSTRTTRTSRSTRTAVSTRSDTTSTAFLDVFDSDDEHMEDLVPWENLRHKSIKRGILERVKKEETQFDSLRGIIGSSFSTAGMNKKKNTESEGGIFTSNREGGDKIEKRPARHGRTDSDLLVDNVNLPALDRIASRSTYPSDQSSKPATLRTDSSQTSTSANSSGTPYSMQGGDKTQWRQGTGFRIVDESPAPIPTPPKEVYSSTFGSGWWWGNNTDVDRYTPMPVKQSGSRSRSSSPLKETRGYHTTMLPQSPPLITSPLLENRLCFTPTPAPRGQTPPVPRVFKTPAVTPIKSAGSTKDRGRKLRSPKVPSLPFPSSPDRGINSPRPDVYRGRLFKQAIRDKTQPVRHPISPQSAPFMPIGHQDAAIAGAMRKVEEIIESSWSMRELGEEGIRSLSPTGFGRRS